MIKTIVLLNFAFKCRSALTLLVNETQAIVLVQAGTQANQIASAIDCAGNINFTENCSSKSFLLFQDSKETCSLIFVCHKKGGSGKHSIRENNTWTVTGMYVFFLICIKLVNIKTKLFWGRIISSTHKKQGKKSI